MAVLLDQCLNSSDPSASSIALFLLPFTWSTLKILTCTWMNFAPCLPQNMESLSHSQLSAEISWKLASFGKFCTISSRMWWGSEGGLEAWIAEWLLWRWVGVCLCWQNEQEWDHVHMLHADMDIQFWRARKSHRCICLRRSVLVGCCPCCAWIFWCFWVLQFHCRTSGKYFDMGYYFILIAIFYVATTDAAFSCWMLSPCPQ